MFFSDFLIRLTSKLVKIRQFLIIFLDNHLDMVHIFEGQQPNLSGLLLRKRGKRIKFLIAFLCVRVFPVLLEELISLSNLFWQPKIFEN